MAYSIIWQKKEFFFIKAGNREYKVTNRQIQFRSVVSEVSSFVGNPVKPHVKFYTECTTVITRKL